MKVDYTIKEYQKVLPKHYLTRHLANISAKMSIEEKETLNDSSGNYVTGELVLYDLLKNNGIPGLLAANLAANFPYAIEFDPSIIRSRTNLKDLFEKDTKSGKRPLEALVSTVTDLERYKFLNGKTEAYIKFVKRNAELNHL